MKSRLFSLLTAIILIATTSISCSAQKMFKNVPSGKGIEKVFVGKGMLALAGNVAAGQQFGSVGFKDAIKSIDQIEIINCEDVSKMKEVQKACEAAVKQSGLILATEVEDEDSKVLIYTLPDSKNPKIASIIVVLNCEEDEYEAVAIHGSIDLTKLSDLGM